MYICMYTYICIYVYIICMCKHFTCSVFYHTYPLCLLEPLCMVPSPLSVYIGTKIEKLLEKKALYLL